LITVVCLKALEGVFSIMAQCKHTNKGKGKAAQANINSEGEAFDLDVSSVGSNKPTTTAQTTTHGASGRAATTAAPVALATQQLESKLALYDISCAY
jgi:hypothetical protein